MLSIIIPKRLELTIRTSYNTENEQMSGETMGIPTNIKTLLSGRVVEWARIELSRPGMPRHP